LYVSTYMVNKDVYTIDVFQVYLGYPVPLAFFLHLFQQNLYG